MTRLPLVAEIEDETLPASWTALAATSAFCLLESAQGGRYTYLCDRPERVILGAAGGAEIWSASADAKRDWRPGPPLTVLDRLLSERRAPVVTAGPPMIGGLIGALAYDLVQSWEQLPRLGVRDLGLPLFALLETRELFIYDHETRRLWIAIWSTVNEDETPDLAFGRAEARAESALARWRAGQFCGSEPSSPCVGEAEPGPDSFTREEFYEAVRRVKDYLSLGHTYQANLSVRRSRRSTSPAVSIYESLKEINPSPYMGLFQVPDFALACGSPELLVRVVDGRIVSRPIAGTRPRGADSFGDEKLSCELSANEKERAEHLMLVDLIRNDIGRVAKAGTVAVTEFMTVEQYSHVMHLVSEVEGQLAEGKRWVDVLRSMFPGGTITGCPKIRTMEIIEELEPVGRGFYTGSLGWISYRGDMEFNIIIRSILLQDGLAHVQAGAGIVADSEPPREYEEIEHKAQALWLGLERAAHTK